CHGVTDTRAFSGVPTAGGEVELTIERGDDAIFVRPWPFSAAELTVHADGRALTETFDNEARLHAALDAANWVTVETTLRP
ncbi:MAG: DUF3891 family protein, partial [Vicinamibacterales bacterium]